MYELGYRRFANRLISSSKARSTLLRDQQPWYLTNVNNLTGANSLIHQNLCELVSLEIVNRWLEDGRSHEDHFWKTGFS
jgi:hypothetical protein